MNRLDRIRGCLLGGAAGDALRAPLEFMAWTGIKGRFGEGPPTFCGPYGEFNAGIALDYPGN